MNATHLPEPQCPPVPDQAWPRDLFLTILHIAFSVGETRFARQAALAWLTAFPGDLPVTLSYAQALIRDGRPDQAIPVLEDLCQSDPEYLEACLLLSQLRSGKGHSKSIDPQGYVFALGGSRPTSSKGMMEQTVILWSRLIGQARAFLEQGEVGRAEEMVHQALAAHPANPLMASTHLKVLQAQTFAHGSPSQAVRNLAEFYHSQWPECLQCSLLLADALMDGGESESAVALLHQAAASDVTGQVATRLWGEAHPYRALWPERLEVALGLAVPAPVAAALGWNRLPMGAWGNSARTSLPVPEGRIDTPENAGPGGEEQVTPWDTPTVAGARNEAHSAIPDSAAFPKSTSTSPACQPGEALRITSRSSQIYASVPETLRSVQAELDRVADRLNKPGLANSDGRLPVYVLLTTRRGLESVYGPENTAALEGEMRRLVEAVQTRRSWRALIFYADEGVCLQGRSTRLVTHPTRAEDAWGLKLALADLDLFLGRKGEMVGAVLIVGGPEIVPFHRLPNPVDDSDEDVPSDNPYGTRDENYFIPEWPVGRLPGGAARGTKDARPLLKSLRILTGQHMEHSRLRQPRTWYRRWAERLSSWFSNHALQRKHIRRSFGYTAAVWRNASFSVFRPIGQPAAMLVSPPAQVIPEEGANPVELPENMPRRRRPGHRNTTKHESFFPVARLAYYNLHGLEDAAEWYGQSDPGDSGATAAGDGPTYPVALRPQDIVNGGRAPQVVFSEACYGAHILNRTIEEAMALKFLQSGSQAVVGCTCTAYGSVNTPLIAADFLGQSFWSYLRKGLPAGEALRRAKISLAHEMHQRQGYLDGEDQKTLISFVLYGDPLALALGLDAGPKAVLRPLKPPHMVHTVCDRARPGESSENLPPETLAHVKRVVEQYLPGMADAQVTINLEHSDCDHAGHECPTAQFGGKAAPRRQPERRLVILSKQVTGAVHLHRHYARLTLDSENRLVKLAVSR